MAGRRAWLGLAVLALPTFVVAIDLFVLLLALPSLSTDLGANSNEQLWITDIYGFLLAGFLITMGTLGDRIGRRRLLLIGAVLFSVASVLTAFAPNPELLILARALLGIAGATLMPSTLALIATMFQNPKQQGTAFGVWAGTFTLGALAGPVIAGVMLAHFWWGSVFLLGVPLMVALLVIGPKLLPEFRNPEPGRLDPTSVVLSLAALLPVIYGIKQLARNGWEVLPLVSLVVGIVCGVLFVRRQRTLKDPLLDLGLISDRTIGGALRGQLSYSMVGGGLMLFMLLYFQLVDGMSPLRAGLSLVPGMAAATAGFQVAPKLASRYRPSYVMGGGLIGSSLALVAISQIGVLSGTLTLIIGFAVFSFFGAAMAGLGTTLVLTSAPQEKAGAAGSLAQLANEFGGTLGIALLGTLGTAVYRAQVADTLPAGLPAAAATSAKDNLVGATTVAADLPGPLGSALLNPAQAAFTNGVQVVAGAGAVLLAGIAVFVAIRLRHVPPFGSEQPAGQEPPEPTEAPGPAEDAAEPAGVGSRTRTEEVVG
jgi:DHA2 family multidrug resistance protein-like MFS transporter